MPQSLHAPAPPPEPPGHKDKRIEIRIEPDLADRAARKANAHGWTVSAVLRALLRLWTDEDLIDPQAIGNEVSQATGRAAKRPRVKRKSKSKK